jgi:hypothetical protein
LWYLNSIQTYQEYFSHKIKIVQRNKNSLNHNSSVVNRENKCKKPDEIHQAFVVEFMLFTIFH